MNIHAEFSNDDLTACVCRYVPEAEKSVSFALVPTGKFNTSFFVTAGDRELVLRIAPPRDAGFLFYERDMMRQEPGIHRLILERTSVPVPRIIAFDDSCDIIDRNFIIMEKLPGRPLCDAARVDGDHVLKQVGQCLAQVHGITADQYGYLGEHRPMEPQDTWAEAFRIMWRKLIEDVEAAGHYSSEECRKLLALLDKFLLVFDRPVLSCLLHMDVWSENILVTGDGNLSGLVDWDRALWGDREIEYAVLDYCGISGPAFWEGYERKRDLSREARTRNVFYLLYEIQKYIVIRHCRNHDPAAARQYKSNVMQIIDSSF